MTSLAEFEIGQPAETIRKQRVGIVAHAMFAGKLPRLDQGIVPSGIRKSSFGVVMVH